MVVGNKNLLILVGLLSTAILTTNARAYPIPVASSYINVKTLGARGDGVTDDTPILKQAVANSNGFVYFPNGTYLVKDRIMPSSANTVKRRRIMGESRTGVIIKLADNSTGYQDTLNPKAVLSFEGGFADQNFYNYVEDITIDVGRGNPGAIGMVYNSANIGAVSNVTIRSTDASKRGTVGLGLTFGGKNGPSLVRNLEVDGFDYGIRVGSDLHIMTFEGMVFKNQRRAVIQNFGGMPMAMRSVTSTNSVPFAVGRFSLVLFDATLTNPSTVGTAFDMLAGATLLRRVNVTGYRHLYGRDTSFTTRTINEFLSHAPVSLFPPAHPTLFTLPLQDVPNPPYENPSLWRNTATGTSGTDESIQAAIDAGATTIFISVPHTVDNTIFVRNRVRRIVHLSSNNLFIFAGDVSRGVKPLFTIQDGTSDTVIIENMEIQAAPKTFVHASRRTLVLKDMGCWTYENTVPGGRLFVDNVSLVSMKLTGQQVYMRQINPERDNHPKIINDNSKVFMLGLKTEHAGTVVRTINGGVTEVAGASIYPVNVIPADQVMFEAINSHVSTAATIPRNYVDSTRTYRNFARETWQSTTRTQKSVPSFFCGGPPSPVTAQSSGYLSSRRTPQYQIADNHLTVFGVAGQDEQVWILNAAGRIIAEGRSSEASPFRVSLSKHGAGALIVKTASKNGVQIRRVMASR